MVNDFDQQLYKLHRTFEIQSRLIKEPLFPEIHEGEEEEVVQDDLSDTSAEEDETENDKCKHDMFNFMLFNLDPDQDHIKHNLLDNTDYISKAESICQKYGVEKVSNYSSIMV